MYFIYNYVYKNLYPPQQIANSELRKKLLSNDQLSHQPNETPGGGEMLSNPLEFGNVQLSRVPVEEHDNIFQSKIVNPTTKGEDEEFEEEGESDDSEQDDVLFQSPSVILFQTTQGGYVGSELKLETATEVDTAKGED